jgi:hypothetical protein
MTCDFECNPVAKINLNKCLQKSKRVVSLIYQNHTHMTTIIFKSEKNAKVYEIRSAKDQGCYKAGELIRRVKTDNIEKLNENGQYQTIAIEVK